MVLAILHVLLTAQKQYPCYIYLASFRANKIIFNKSTDTCKTFELQYTYML